MMSYALNFFPVITQEIIDKIDFNACAYELYYNYEGSSNKLNLIPLNEQTDKGGYLKIVDDKCAWVPDIQDLCLKRKYKINNPRYFFGEYGVACEDAELGIAIAWSSKTSNQRGVELIGSFKNSSVSPVWLEIEFSFLPGQLKGSVNLQTIIFIKKSGANKANEKHLSNSEGIILGTLDEYTIIIDGNGSAFPIVEVSDESQPLWWVMCDWDDPFIDSFDEENVCIYINNAHPNYQLLKIEDGLKASPMLTDIIACAIQIIIQKVKDSCEWKEVLAGQNMESGSIAQAVNYFISTFEWDVKSPEKLALSIRKDFDTRI